jgi:hypothetical protein
MICIWEEERHDFIEQSRRDYARKYYITHLYLAQAWQRLFEVLDSVQYGIESHERLGKRSELFVKRMERWFARQSRADEHDHKIDEVVMRHPRARVKRTCSWIAFRIPVWVST